MATYTFDLRGRIEDKPPEKSLSGEPALRWFTAMPKADRFGIHSALEYRFISISDGGANQAVLAADITRGLFKVPLSELWEVFAIEQYVTATGAAGVFTKVEVNLVLPKVFWDPAANRWSGYLQSMTEPLTRPRALAGGSVFLVRDEANETDPDSGLRKRILYPGTELQANIDHGAGETLTHWFVRLDLVRYPSNKRLQEMIDKGEVERSELFAMLAHRAPSPAESF